MSGKNPQNMPQQIDKNRQAGKARQIDNQRQVDRQKEGGGKRNGAVNLWNREESRQRQSSKNAGIEASDRFSSSSQNGPTKEPPSLLTKLRDNLQSVPSDKSKPPDKSNQPGRSAVNLWNRETDYDSRQKIGSLLRPDEFPDDVATTELLGRYADALEKKRDGQQSGKKELDDSTTNVKALEQRLEKLERKLTKLDSAKAAKKEKKPDADFRAGQARDYTLEHSLSDQERAERKAIAHPQGGIGFEFGKDKARKSEYKRWYSNLSDEQKNALKDPDIIVTITTMTSQPGKRSYNQKLANGRGEGVADTLVNEYGIDRSRIRIEALGEDPARDNNPNTPDDKDDRNFRVASIDFSTTKNNDSVRREERIKVSEDQAIESVNKLLSPFPEPPERNMWIEARENLFNPLSLKGIAEFGINGVKNWLEASADARKNFNVSANFIPSFMGRIEQLTTGKTKFGPIRNDSADALLGRSFADAHFIRMLHQDRVTLVAAMNDNQLRPGILKHMKYDLLRRFIAK